MSSTPYSWAVPGALCACRPRFFDDLCISLGLCDWPRAQRVYTVRAVYMGCSKCCYNSAVPHLYLEELHVPLSPRHTQCCGSSHEIGWGADGFRPVRATSIDTFTRLLVPHHHRLETTS